MATHSSILIWRILWTEEPAGLQSMGLQESDMTERLTLSLLNIRIIYLNHLKNGDRLVLGQLSVFKYLERQTKYFYCCKSCEQFLVLFYKYFCFFCVCIHIHCLFSCFSFKKIFLILFTKVFRKILKFLFTYHIIVIKAGWR